MNKPKKDMMIDVSLTEVEAYILYYTLHQVADCLQIDVDGEYCSKGDFLCQMNKEGMNALQSILKKL